MKHAVVAQQRNYLDSVSWLAENENDNNYTLACTGWLRLRKSVFKPLQFHYPACPPHDSAGYSNNSEWV